MLIENIVSKPELVAEHDFSLYIETRIRKSFDTGQTGSFIQNSQKIGIDVESSRAKSGPTWIYADLKRELDSKIFYNFMRRNYHKVK